MQDIAKYTLHLKIFFKPFILIFEAHSALSCQNGLFSRVLAHCVTLIVTAAAALNIFITYIRLDRHVQILWSYLDVLE